MLYDVNVSRISTATQTIRVEAESAGQAEEKAVETAHDTDFTGCVVDYDFECNGATEVLDEDTSVAGTKKDSMSTGNYAIQHESDDEPTYIVKAGTDEEVVTLAPSLPWQVRRKIAEIIVAELGK